LSVVGNARKGIAQMALRSVREFGEKITLSIKYARDLICPFRNQIAKIVSISYMDVLE
jgi:hypothetical protein